jgi:hypothetical protein
MLMRRGESWKGSVMVKIALEVIFFVSAMVFGVLLGTWAVNDLDLGLHAGEILFTLDIPSFPEGFKD